MINGAGPGPEAPAGWPVTLNATGAPGTDTAGGEVIEGFDEVVEVEEVFDGLVVVGAPVVVELCPAGFAPPGGSVAPFLWPRGSLPGCGWVVVVTIGAPVVVVVVVAVSAAQMASNCGATRGAGSPGFPFPGFWNRHPSTSPGVTVPKAPVLA